MTEYPVYMRNGEMPEWSNGQSWKDCVPEMAPRVRISLSPPVKGSVGWGICNPEGDGCDVSQNICAILICMRLLVAAVFVGFVIMPNVSYADFSPTSVANLQLWLDASQGVTKDGIIPAGDGDAVQQWNDQSGNSNDATQDTLGSRPVLHTNVFNGKSTLRFDGTVFMTTASFLDSSFDNDFTFFIVSNKLTTDLTVTTSNQGGPWYSARTTGFVANTSHLSSIQSTTDSFADTQFGVGTFRYDGAVKTFGFKTASTTYLSTEDATGDLGLDGSLTIGQLPGGGFGYDGDIPEIIMYNRALSDTEVHQVENYLMLKYNDSPDNLLPGVVFTGDSMTSGLGSTGGQTYPKQTNDLLGGTGEWLYWNYGQAGAPVSYLIDNASIHDDRSYGVLRPYNILSVWVGTNDLYDGTNPNTVYADILSYITKERSLGFKVIVNTVLPRTQVGISPTFEDDRQTLNSLIRTNWQSFADGLSDVAADERIGDYGDQDNPTYFVDGVHMMNAGYSIIADHVAEQINILTDSAAPTVSITSPLDNATVQGEINISATASDNVGVVGVQFEIGTSSIDAEDTTDPYSASLDTTSLEDGTYSIVAVARDAKNNYATSTITVTVLNTVPEPSVQVSSVPRRSGSSASNRVRNLLSAGLNNQAQIVAAQYNIIIPNKPISSDITAQSSRSLYTRNLKQGMSGDDVKQLQVFLNSKGFIIAKEKAGSPGHETNYFGQLTKAALMKFQEAHKDEVLDLQGLKSSTGFFGTYTMSLVNKMIEN